MAIHGYITGVIADNLPADVVSSPPASVSAYTCMQAFVAECVCDLDCTIASSYDGSSQEWYNLIDDPYAQSAYADGSARAWDLFLGVTSGAEANDPTYTSAESSKMSAYFLCDGADGFTSRLYDKSPSAPQLVSVVWNSLEPFSIAMIAYHVSAATGYTYWAAKGGGNPSKGFAWGFNGGDTAQLTYNCSSTNRITTYTGTSNIHGKYALTVFAIDPRTATSGAYTRTDGVTISAQGSIAPTTSTSGLNRIGLAMLSSGTTYAKTGTRIVAYSAYNKYLTSADVSVIITEYNLRHGRTYL